VLVSPAGDADVELEVVGVIENIRHADLRTDGLPAVYLPARSFTWADWELMLVVRTATAPKSLVEPIRARLAALDPMIPMAKVRTMDEYVAAAVSPTRFALVLSGALAALALLLTGVGIYGVLSFMLARSEHELGIRAALGAPRHRLLWLTLRRGLRPVALGLVLGIAGSWLLRRWLAPLLFGVGADDLPTWLAAIAVALLTAAVAGTSPARRALGLDPALAIRSGSGTIDHGRRWTVPGTR
jgi:predicted lysophospholipase L1 biosynthesis ABC-type transport system permease subunit